MPQIRIPDNCLSNHIFVSSTWILHESPVINNDHVCAPTTVGPTFLSWLLHSPSTVVKPLLYSSQYHCEFFVSKSKLSLLFVNRSYLGIEGLWQALIRSRLCGKFNFIFVCEYNLCSWNMEHTFSRMAHFRNGNHSMCHCSGTMTPWHQKNVVVKNGPE